MRILILAMGLVAIASGPALSQITRGSQNAGTAAATTGTAASTSTTGTTTTTTTLPSTSVGAEAVLTAPASSAPAGTSTTATDTGNGFGTNNLTDPNAAANATPAFGPGGSFSNDSGNRALGTSPGQSSSGTAVGNSSSGLGTNSATLGVGTAGIIGSTGTVVPDGTVSVIGGSTGSGVVGVPATQSQQVTIAPAAPTPLFDQVAREGREKEARRRARGDEPRVYGIAPNTERDLTWQMPDDRIIRY